MGFRRFVDRDGHAWDVRPRSRSEWDFEPVAENPGPLKSAAAPSYEQDPYELSQEELQRLLDGARALQPSKKQSPFRD